MADLTSAAQRLAARQHGVISIRQLVASGVGRKTIRRLDRAEVLIADYKSVYRLGSSPRTLEQRCVELSLAHPSAFVTGPTAGTLMGLRKMPRRSPITMSAKHPLHVEHAGVRFRRSTKVSPADVIVRNDGIRIAHPVRLAFDLAGWLDDHAHRSVVDQLLHEHDVTVGELVRVGSRLFHPARRGSDRFVNTLNTLTETPTESDAERRVADALRRRGVPVETNAQWLTFPDGQRARLDLSVPSARWGVEVDVHPSHLGVIGSTNDKRRDRRARLIGWQIERITGLDLLDLEATCDELSALYSVRCREVAA
ncbi:type IV toxin-antitoxin system AbiEi family antitoxin domain-containing protein [Ilumatobacter coccineus]|uniref:AbiEi antitoxin N-terminal domain-containing protein n=1 Tax=Ilumatobacter coccineus (strain NBRC 103263 / KCTC 29153 / YM16-304) TaxID=1313172 RepID=A0A6C7EBK5_ILUCY|nr:type IV toxin-antitoxin system AbiEi family antitoxin domain-containing protein [Ilumatobacter coccineus]BAN03382.1 hypothetical protein YM304_30680 [Ilumatobacter coccineus YM16-304]